MACHKRKDQKDTCPAIKNTTGYVGLIFVCFIGIIIFNQGVLG